MDVLKGVGFKRGPEQHTFTAIGRCPRTGRLGVSVTTGEIGTGGRVPSVMANVGAIGTQASTDPRLGPLAIKLLELGYPACVVLGEPAYYSRFGFVAGEDHQLHCKLRLASGTFQVKALSDTEFEGLSGVVEYCSEFEPYYLS